MTGLSLLAERLPILVSHVVSRSYFTMIIAQYCSISSLCPPSLCVIGAKNSLDILAAEQTIRDCLRALEGVQAIPNIVAGFQTVDTKRTGKCKAHMHS